jgi:hypothetical protein
MGEPHAEQNERNLPGEDSNSRSVSLPLLSRKLLRATGALAACAEPLALRQLVQWQ